MAEASRTPPSNETDGERYLADLEARILPLYSERRRDVMATARKLLAAAAEQGSRRYRIKAYRHLAQGAIGWKKPTTVQRYVAAAERLLDACETTDETIRERANLADICGWLVSDGSRGDTAGAIRHFSRSASLRRGINDKSGLARCLFKLGEAYSHSGMYEAAYTTLDEALQAAESCGDRHAQAQVLGVLAQNLLAAGDTERAVALIDEAVAIAPTKNGKTDLCRIAGIVYRSAARYEEAERFYAEYAEHHRITGDRFRQTLSLYDIGQVRHGQHRLHEAVELLDSARRTFEELGHSGGLTLVLIELAQCHEKLRQFDQATTWYLEGIEHAGLAGMPMMEMTGHRLLGDLYDRRGKVRLALDQYRRFMDLDGRFLTSSIRQRIATYPYEQHTRTGQQEADRQVATAMAEMSLRMRHDTEIMDRLRERLVAARNEANADRALIDDVIATLDRRTARLEGWDTFDRQIKALDRHFTTALATRCPDLTPAELRTCALVRLAMSNKEIAALLNLSERTIDTHRMHIRRKLGLDRMENLTSVLAAL